MKGIYKMTLIILAGIGAVMKNLLNDSKRCMSM